MKGRRVMSKLLSFCAAILLILGSGFVTTATYGGSPEEDVTAAYAAWDAAFGKADAARSPHSTPMTPFCFRRRMTSSKVRLA